VANPRLAPRQASRGIYAGKGAVAAMALIARDAGRIRPISNGTAGVRCTAWRDATYSPRVPGREWVSVGPMEVYASMMACERLPAFEPGLRTDRRGLRGLLGEAARRTGEVSATGLVAGDEEVLAGGDRYA